MSIIGDHSVTSGLEPVTDHGPAESGRGPVDGTALCLSGGGYRAMLFHVGGIIRLNELGRLATVDRVSSVSGGSITAGVLGLAWKRLEFAPDGGAGNLRELVVEPILELAGNTIDTRSILTGLALPFRSVAERVAEAYDRHLYHGKTLQDLPAAGEGPRFVINATNVQTGRLFRFSQPYAGDYSVGLWRTPTTRVADAVAASSAFPPVLSPHTVRPSGTFDPATAGEHGEPYRRTLWLADGGVYDNLGLETAWKRYRTLLVSDGGGALAGESKPKRNWAQHGIRVAEIVDGQVRALRKRQLIDGYVHGIRSGAYWGVRSDPADFPLADAMPFPAADRERAASVKTRLAALDDDTRRVLVNWGYVIADTALRSFAYPGTDPPSSLPV